MTLVLPLRAIERTERLALEDPLPVWLERLVATWFDTEATLVTFNYDTLIERAASAQRRLDNWGEIYEIPLNRRSPISHGLSTGAAMYTELIPELFKLHGSTNWGFPGLDSSPSDPVTIMRNDGRWSTNTSPSEVARGQQAARYADLKQLIIPPTGTKGAFYSNHALKAQWKTAFDRLQSATSLTIIGYSFPLAT
ncbi:SIR2 family protein [Arthrobacter sp. TMS1-12-1]